MKPGILILGVLTLIISAGFYYADKPVATPANPDGLNDVAEGTLSRNWSAAGMALGGIIIILALILPKGRIDPRKSPMKEYPKTSAGQDDGIRHDPF